MSNSGEKKGKGVGGSESDDGKKKKQVKVCRPPPGKFDRSPPSDPDMEDWGLGPKNCGRSCADCPLKNKKKA